MSKQRVAVTWEVCGYIEVEADSIEEAMNMVDENPDDYKLPIENYYIDGSFGLSTYDVEEMKAICNC